MMRRWVIETGFEAAGRLVQPLIGSGGKKAG